MHIKRYWGQQMLLGMEFIYSTSNSYIDVNGNMSDISNKEGYIVHKAFHNDAQGELTGFWYTRYNKGITITQIENEFKSIDSNDLANTSKGAVGYLIYSKYGEITNLQTY